MGWQVKSGWMAGCLHNSCFGSWNVEHTAYSRVEHGHRKFSSGIWNMRAPRFPTISVVWGGCFGFLALHVRLCLPPNGSFYYYYFSFFFLVAKFLRHLPRYALHLLLFTKNTTIVFVPSTTLKWKMVLANRAIDLNAVANFVIAYQKCMITFWFRFNQNNTNVTWN